MVQGGNTNKIEGSLFQLIPLKPQFSPRIYHRFEKCKQVSVETSSSHVCLLLLGASVLMFMRRRESLDKFRSLSVCPSFWHHSVSLSLSLSLCLSLSLSLSFFPSLLKVMLRVSERVELFLLDDKHERSFVLFFRGVVNLWQRNGFLRGVVFPKTASNFSKFMQSIEPNGRLGLVCYSDPMCGIQMASYGQHRD